ncbi:hypothetical protein M406DRAFT_75770 [Cryphonectria parasitica EP155]|uniref:Uncharacterized protein n=1 Tax=Cryphonectria parasitica (strain ATCC 38755 / EP155) TaxID=660469 RepID=A0A9P4YA62_CRYP1|nr:uncharacterized protein M406DRAFT_75770 [Cryphonectria parasitica EP155]KAF3769285.1 hypothetical protein M406DRAFT_75770 [Cryphonectria parasitica EP155]
MPGPYTEDEKLYLETVNQFLAKADTQALHAEMKSLRETVTGFDSRLTQVQEANTELTRANEMIQSAHELLETRLKESMGVNDELKTKVEELLRTVEATADVNAGLQATNEGLRDSVESLRKRFMLAQQDKKGFMTLQGQLTQVLVRLDEAEDAIDHVAKLASQGEDDTSSVHGQRYYTYANHMVQFEGRPAQEPKRRQIEEWGHDMDWTEVASPPEIAHHAEYDDEPSVSQNFEQLEFPSRYEFGIPPKQIVSPRQQQKQQLLVSRKHAEPVREISGNRTATREQPGAQDAEHSGSKRLRLEAIQKHCAATIHAFEAAPPKNHRRFIWAFINGFNDHEFSMWLQEQLLENLPPTMIRRASMPFREHNRRIALTPTVTWEAVREVMKHIQLVPFLE